MREKSRCRVAGSRIKRVGRGISLEGLAISRVRGRAGNRDDCAPSRTLVNSGGDVEKGKASNVGVDERVLWPREVKGRSKRAAGGGWVRSRAPR